MVMVMVMVTNAFHRNQRQSRESPLHPVSWIITIGDYWNLSSVTGCLSLEYFSMWVHGIHNTDVAKCKGFTMHVKSKGAECHRVAGNVIRLVLPHCPPPLMDWQENAIVQRRQDLTICTSYIHTCKKRVMLRWRLFWPKKNAEKVRKSRQNVNRDKSA